MTPWGGRWLEPGAWGKELERELKWYEQAELDGKVVLRYVLGRRAR